MSKWLPLLSLTLVLAACAEQDAPAAEAADAASADAPADAQSDRIAVAMSGGPLAITADATIMDFDESGNLVELRAGTNGWMCVPDDNPVAPGDAPMCVDGAWQSWMTAWMSQTTPEIEGIGISYMLQGSLAPSNEDPYATEPAEGEDWIEDGPHLMVVVPDPAMLDAFPTDPTWGGPYVMWKGTPYAHLMVPTGN